MNYQNLVYKPNKTVRIVTAASLFDGHDAAINIMRRIIQSTGAEVIHLGHNRSVGDIVSCAIQEDAQAVAITSYQGGHIEYFKYMYDLLKERNAGHIKIFGGGGGTILPSEIEELQAYGISRIFSPDDGREMGLQGMINYLVEQSDYYTPVVAEPTLFDEIRSKNAAAIASAITQVEKGMLTKEQLDAQNRTTQKAPILGITGTGGAGKSSLTDELIWRFLEDFPEKTIAIFSVDPSKRKTGGALLGDRIRMNSVSSDRVYMRSFATKQANIALNRHVADALSVLQLAGFDLIIVETAGIGQSDSEITSIADVSLYVMTPEYGAASQLEKIDMIDYADLVAINKFDKRGALDSLRDVKKQYQRSRGLWNVDKEEMPVYGTIASQFNDPGTNTLYVSIIEKINSIFPSHFDSHFSAQNQMSEKIYIIPPDRTRYLAEIAEESQRYNQVVTEQSELARSLFQVKGTIDLLTKH
ncbi:MAG: cobalamin-dependent protein [Candidatus Kapabacteria bacterium]|nr:cobalamin-dependent protein [Candidatus Kapabacteria bacterium]